MIEAVLKGLGTEKGSRDNEKTGEQPFNWNEIETFGTKKAIMKNIRISVEVECKEQTMKSSNRCSNAWRNCNAVEERCINVRGFSREGKW